MMIFNLLLDDSWQLFDFVFAMDLLFCRAFINKLLFLALIDIAANNWIKITLLPELFGGLSPQNIIIERGLLFMMLQIAVRDNVVVSLCRHLQSLATDAVLLSRFRALARRLEVMIFHIDVADDVVVHDGVLAGTEVPRLLLWIVSAFLETLELVIEVEDVVRLLIAKCSVLNNNRFIRLLMICLTYLVRGQSLDHVLLFEVANLLLSRRITETLRDRVVLDLLRLDAPSIYFAVWLLHILLSLLRIMIALHVLAPGVIVVTNTHLRASHICSGHLRHCINA